MGKSAKDYLIQLPHLGVHPLYDRLVAMAVHTGIPGRYAIYIFLPVLPVQDGTLRLYDAQHFWVQFVLGKGVPQVFLIPFRKIFQLDYRLKITLQRWGIWL